MTRAKSSFLYKISPSRTLPIGTRAVSQSALSHPSGAVRRLPAGPARTVREKRARSSAG
ncbi:hypothetical protein NK6_4688 [Bradyrhizobium diazoefficiens]|uniref:Uncharacterized protein n=1 Tax=Bradyrhizobium diazoefficiens TaxID=1355477 RepID=A0A0E3VUR2_9BRAD|nr:hypothetical protein NK6_4688 [Bradyrhizobium diazoefficiens]